MSFTDIGTSFVLGLLTPLTAVCVLPLYPGFLSYLSNQLKGKEENSRLPVYLGLLVTLGVLVFMTLLGLIFTTLFQKSLTTVIGVVSPIAFGILGVISLLLIFNVDFTSIIPKKSAPILKNSYLTAFLFGFFFGAIVIPCNPGFIAAFFARALLVDNVVSSMSNFLFFGIGLSFPLLVFSVISGAKSQLRIGWCSFYDAGVYCAVTGYCDWLLVLVEG